MTLIGIALIVVWLGWYTFDTFFEVVEVEIDEKKKTAQR